MNEFEVSSRFICGVVMITAASLITLKTYTGSNNGFAYFLMSITFVVGLSYVGLAVCGVMKVSGQVYQNQQALNIFYFMYFTATALSAWGFAAQIFQSCQDLSLQQQVNRALIKKGALIMFGLYFSLMTGLLMGLLVTFPGYSSALDFDNWYSGVSKRLFVGMELLWCFISILSSVIIVYSTVKIHGYLRGLNLRNSTLNLLLYVGVATIQNCAIFLSSINYSWSIRVNGWMGGIIPILDLVLQISLCKICYDQAMVN